MKKISFKQAAIKILKDADEPLSAKEITEIALEEDLIETTGVTPSATMAAQLYTDLISNKSSQFKKVGRGLFALKKQTESVKSPLIAIQNQNELVKVRLMDKIRKMDPFQFEYLTAELLSNIGYENVEVTKRSGDKGIDVIANLTVGGLTNVKTVIQAKRYKKGNNIAGKYITQLRGSAEVDQRGLIITTSDFTKGAIDEARASNKMPVALVNGNKLIDLLFKYKVGVKEDLVSVFSIHSELFENELSDSTVVGVGIKNKSIWPLPGGVNSYIETLTQLLNKINSSESSRKELVEWFLENFENVSSRKTANGYLNVPKSMGLIEFHNNICILTTDGKEFYNSKNIEFLYQTISKNILAFEEVYQLLITSNTAKSEQQILDYINENFDVDWNTYAQVNFRLRWLMNMGMVEKTTLGFIGIS
jgi:restriction endonuclease Mrr